MKSRTHYQVPRPDLHLTIGTPDACNSADCHSTGLRKNYDQTDTCFRYHARKIPIVDHWVTGTASWDKRLQIKDLLVEY